MASCRQLALRFLFDKSQQRLVRIAAIPRSFTPPAPTRVRGFVRYGNLALSPAGDSRALFVNRIQNSADKDPYHLPKPWLAETRSQTG